MLHITTALNGSYKIEQLDICQTILGIPAWLQTALKHTPLGHSDPVKAQQGRGVALVGVKGAAGMSIFIHSPISS